MKDKLKDVLNRATDYKGPTSRKVTKGILGAIIIMLLGALGLEVSNNDFDLGKIFGGSSLEESKVARDDKGNVVYYDKKGDVTNDAAKGKKSDDYNCDDFSDQPEAQGFFMKVGGAGHDLNRLDGDKDGEACEGLRKTAKAP